MDIRAILLIGRIARDGARPAESVGGVPIAYLDVLGLPVVERVRQRLARFGIRRATLVSDVPPGDAAAAFTQCSALHRDMRRIDAAGEQFWQAADDTFQQYGQDGADLVLVLRIGPYAEIDYEEMIQHHLDHRCAVTTAVDAENPGLDVFVLNAAGRLDARELFQSRLQRLRHDCQAFQVTGYVNRLQSPSDLRRLAADGLLARNEIRPHGFELKPGVWVGAAARIHRKARVVAPAFIGARATVRALAVITRGSVVEHHAEIDCGTVVENSSVLPFTRLGAGLDVMHSVVGLGRLAHLARGVEVEISDRRFVDMVPLSPLSRLAGSTAALFAFLPKQIYRGFFAPSHRKSAPESPESLEQAQPVLEVPVLESPASGGESSGFPSSLAVVRRYGEH